MSLARRLDEVLSVPAIVFGSLPPSGRDLDLLLRDEGLAVAYEVLRDAGCTRRGHRWVRFTGCEVDPVDVVPLSEWRLPAAEGDALFARALPVPGYPNLLRPEPGDALLIIARRLERDGLFDDKRRSKVETVLKEDREAWDKAATRAHRWNAGSALAALRKCYGEGEKPPSASGHRRLRSLGRGCVVALSGLDGSGKSTQARALQASLQRLGFTVTIEWTRLSYNPILDRIALPIKTLIGRRGSGGDALADPGKELRRKSSAVTHAWAAIVAVANGVTHLRRTLPHVLRGTVVICDRYTLDSSVHLRYRYGPKRRFKLQSGFVRMLSPKPIAAFFLEVPPEIAIDRKPEQYTLEQLQLQAQLYADGYERLRYRRLDGCRSREELCEEIARTVWGCMT